MRFGASSTPRRRTSRLPRPRRTWPAIDADTKLIPSFFVGGRDAYAANVFIRDLAQRLSHRWELTSDGHKPYLDAVERAFGDDIDYAMLVKHYGPALEGPRRYS